MGVQAVLVVLLMFTATVMADQGGVTFWRKEVTLTCPENGTFHFSNGSKHEGKTYTFEYKSQMKVQCEYPDFTEGNKKYYFYVKGKACENCFELDAEIFGLVIFVDVIGTAVVMIIIFKFTKKKSSDEPTHFSKPPAPSRSQPPSVPSRDYEQLNPHTRTVDTYSTVVNRTG
ncbi:T-cell surface glycoprotein CD3 epsilon chain-like [Odontesthes bonariensis]|uniref:T-cell surface glycoprotein CD3 epsilon chain-like n=1 Tax=Odontesthes bonariensis TaxID=219752 RepID=UPI003F584E60